MYCHYWYRNILNDDSNCFRLCYYTWTLSRLSKININHNLPDFQSKKWNVILGEWASNKVIELLKQGYLCWWRFQLFAWHNKPGADAGFLGNVNLAWGAPVCFGSILAKLCAENWSIWVQKWGFSVSASASLSLSQTIFIMFVLYFMYVFPMQ